MRWKFYANFPTPALTVWSAVLPTGDETCGLRDYGTGEWDGGEQVWRRCPECGGEPKNTAWDCEDCNGDGGWYEDCDHLQNNRYSESTTLNAKVTDGASEAKRTPYRDKCGKCGATRVDQQMGLEPAPDLFVASMVAVFQEVRRVLADHGTCWVNLGDSYASSGQRGDTRSGFNDRYFGTSNGGGKQAATASVVPASTVPDGLKPKDLVGIPWRVAFALQADGWYLRSDIVWAKPNPMPESVTDRPTKAHEYVFLLTKRPRYWFDSEAVREPAEFGRGTDPTGKMFSRVGAKGHTHEGGRNVRSVWQIDYTEDEEVEWIGKAGFCLVCGGLRIAGNGSAVTTAQATDASSVSTESAAPTESPTNTSSGQSPKDTPSTTSARTRDASTPPTSNQWSAESTSSEAPTHSQPKTPQRPIASTATSSHPRTPTADPTVAGNVVRVCDCGCDDGEQLNAPDVWRIATQPYPEAHFATFPEELARRCILAGCPTRVCRVCGKPSERIVDAITSKSMQKTYRGAAERISHGLTRPGTFVDAFRETLGWSDCGHNDWRPGIVLDPFIGSGTVAKVARDHQRHAIGIDLNRSYLELAARRLQQLSLLT